MADTKIVIDLGLDGKGLQKEVGGLKKVFVEMEKSLSKTVKSVEKGFGALVASGRALNNTLSNMSSAAERTLASFDEIDRLGGKRKAEGGGTVTINIDNSSSITAVNELSTSIQNMGDSIQQLFDAGLTTSLEIDNSSSITAVNELSISIQNMGNSIQQFFDVDLTTSLEVAIDKISIEVQGLQATFVSFWLGIVNLGDPLKDWFSGDIIVTLQGLIATVNMILSGLIDTIKITFSSIWELAILPALTQWATNIVPLLLEMIAQCILTFGALLTGIQAIFETIGGIILNGIGLFTGFLEFLIGVFTESWAAAWQGIVDIFTVIFETIGDIIQNNLDSFVGFLEFLIGIFAEGWAAAWQGIVDMFTTVVETFGGIIQGVIDLLTSIISFLTEVFSGDWATVWQGIVDIFTTVVETVGGIIQSAIDLLTSIISFLTEVFSGDWADVWQGIIDTLTNGLLTGIISFLTEVFSGDWADAWQGIVDIFTNIFGGVSETVKGVVNAVIGVINGMISAVATGINTVIGAINKLSIKIPDWIPGLGGATIGFSIPTITAPRIPHLAMGAVIPPNREFMAVLGDQRHGNNIETPEGLLRQIFREESGNGAVVAELREILAAVRGGKVMMVNNRELGRIVQETLSSAARAGSSLVPVM